MCLAVAARMKKRQHLSGDNWYHVSVYDDLSTPASSEITANVKSGPFRGIAIGAFSV